MEFARPGMLTRVKVRSEEIRASVLFSAPAAGPYSVVKVLVPGPGPRVGRLRVQGVVALKLGSSGHLARLEISRTELPGQILPVGLPL